MVSEYEMTPVSTSEWTWFDLAGTDVVPAVADAGSPVVAAQQLAAVLAHVVVGRVVPLLVLEGRAWDTGLENLWVHVDSERMIDWVGVLNPLLRALPADPSLAVRGGICDGIVALPSEAALTTWVAHRAHRALAPLFGRLHEVSGGVLTIPAMWHIVGSAVVAAASQLPLLVRDNGLSWPHAGTEEAGMRRAQGVLDAFVRFGAPVRGIDRPWQIEGLRN